MLKRSLLIQAVPQASLEIRELPAGTENAQLPAGNQTQQLPARNQTVPSIGDITFEDGILNQITTHDGNETFRLRYSPNGNTYAVPESKVPEPEKEFSGWFATDPSGAFIIGDSHGRFYHAYLDTITKFGVSRLRLHKPDEMPKTAQLMVFAGVDVADQVDTLPPDGQTEIPYLMLSDLGGDVYFPIMCVYADEDVYPKIFLANDTDTGAQLLMSNDPLIVDNVTGGNITECGYVPLTNGVGGQDIAIIADDEE